MSKLKYEVNMIKFECDDDLYMKGYEQGYEDGYKAALRKLESTHSKYRDAM